MQIYNDISWKLYEIEEKWFKLEKEMQKLTEKNLDNIFKLEFIATEFQLNNLRIDTLAFDNETNSFVIIEYKRWNSYSVIDQAMSYLALMLNNKANFIQELSRKRNKFIDIKSIDWASSKIMILADSFNRYQKQSINFKDLPVELWEVKKFLKDIIIFNPIKVDKTTESIKTILNSEAKDFEKIKEIKTYDENYHLKWKNKEIIEIYENLKDFILNLDNNFQLEYKKLYIAFKINNKNIFDICIWKSFLDIFINLKKWEIDENPYLLDMSNKWHYWNWDYKIKITNSKNLFLIKNFLEETFFQKIKN